jgi:hypothetical protein
MDAPVKRLLKIVVQPTFIMGSATDAPAADPNAALPKVITASPTGRVSNGLFDVIHFQMLVDVEAENVPLFLRTLAKNRFITAYQVDMKILDNAQKSAEGFRYGNRPVAALNVQCEILFFREWLSKYMPPLVKKQLNIQPPAVAAAG